MRPTPAVRRRGTGGGWRRVDGRDGHCAWQVRKRKLRRLQEADYGRPQQSSMGPRKISSRVLTAGTLSCVTYSDC